MARIRKVKDCPGFGLIGLVTEKGCRLIGRCLNIGVTWGERFQDFSSGIGGLYVSSRVEPPRLMGRQPPSLFPAASSRCARVRRLQGWSRRWTAHLPQASTRSVRREALDRSKE